MLPVKGVRNIAKDFLSTRPAPLTKHLPATTPATADPTRPTLVTSTFNAQATVPSATPFARLSRLISKRIALAKPPQSNQKKGRARMSGALSHFTGKTAARPAQSHPESGPRSAHHRRQPFRAHNEPRPAEASPSKPRWYSNNLGQRWPSCYSASWVKLGPATSDQGSYYNP
jgi:hypothetical protein